MEEKVQNRSKNIFWITINKTYIPCNENTIRGSLWGQKVKFLAWYYKTGVHLSTVCPIQLLKKKININQRHASEMGLFNSVKKMRTSLRFT